MRCASGYMLETPSIRRYSPASRGSDNATGADNQQGSPRDPSETIRRTSASEWMMRWSHLHGDMQGRMPRTCCPLPSDTEVRLKSEIPCRVRTTCPAAPQGAAEYRLISGKPYRPRSRVIPREVLGTPSDPVTTDPKGEAGPNAPEAQTNATRNTPALIKQGSLWSAACLIRRRI
jgi:hypothetical protein